ncbi:hypothetical protein [Aliarcobacter butzleri]|uniref:hypothetical protein n=1 Tax=Aliarcobacter butzleri TaxID=28197 RepID=UPI002B24FF24|nr:hypothetical protein [Aliarcobacter butzleri]
MNTKTFKTINIGEKELFFIKSYLDDFLKAQKTDFIFISEDSNYIKQINYNVIEDLLLDSGLELNSFKSIEEYIFYLKSKNKDFNVKDLDSFIVNCFNKNKNKEIYFLNNHFSINKEALIINNVHKGLNLSIINLKDFDKNSIQTDFLLQNVILNEISIGIKLNKISKIN